MPEPQRPSRPLVEPRPRKPWRRRAILASAAVALVAGAVAVVAPWPAEPVDVAREFLEAVRAKDLDHAYELAEGDRPAATGRERFVDRQALRDDWRIGAVTETSRRENDGGEEVFVRYELTGPGKLRGAGSLKVYRSEQHPEKWIVAYPLQTVHVDAPPLRYLDVNAVHAPRDFAYYHLLPGLYDFYARDSSPHVLEQSQLVMITGHADEYAPTTVVHTAVIADSVWPELDTAARARIQACAEQTVAAPPGCPFRVADPGQLTEIEDLRWRIEELPSVVAEPVRHGSPWFDSLPVSFTAPPDGGNYSTGTVALTATGTTAEGDRTRVTSDCGMLNDFLEWAITADGALLVEDSQDGQAAAWSTCRKLTPA